MGQTLLVAATEFKSGPHKQPNTTRPGRASPNPIALQIVYPAQGIFFLCHSLLRANAFCVNYRRLVSMTKGFPRRSLVMLWVRHLSDNLLPEPKSSVNCSIICLIYIIICPWWFLLLQEFKGYAFKIMGGCDKHGFPM
jgi:hypothetical protein